MLGTPLLLTLDLTRVEDAEDPYAFRFHPQDYLARTEGGAVSRIHLEWDQAWLDDLDRVRRPSPAPSTLQRVGRRLSEFLASAEWAAQSAAIEGVVRAGRSAVLTIRSNAAELYALPWELLLLGASGQHLGELDGVVVRYEWPETSTAPEVPSPRHERGRVLLAWSAAGGPVPAREHVEVVAAILDRAHRPLDRERDVLSHASLEALEATLEEASTEGPPVDVLHILAHAKGGLDGGLVLDGAEGRAARVGPEKLRQLLGRHAGMIRLVVFSACESADPGDVASAHGGLTQVLHRAGVAAVLGSRFPLAVEASLRFSRALYEGLLLSLKSLEESVARARAALRQRSETADWATLQLYARTADGADNRPLIIRPYRGLLPYGPEDRRLFFGRDGEVLELRRDLDRLAESDRPRVMIVAGASGSGKSSVVLAGLVPSLLGDAEERWSWTLMRPGAAPMGALATALGRLRGAPVTATPAAIIHALAGWREEHPGRRLLLVVDQLEEIFTQGADGAERTTFVRLLWAIAGGTSSPVTIVSTLRVDFIGACGQITVDEGGLGLDRIAYDERHRTFVARADRRLLRTVIEAPARTVGLSLEPGLIERLIDDIDGDAGALPALSHALDLLWHRRRGDRLTQEGYDAIGGVKGALALYAETIVADLDRESLLQARRLLVRLVGDGLDGASRDTRTRLPRDRMRPPGAEGEAFDRMLGTLTERRLLVLSEGLLDRGPSAPSGVLVEVAHEALLRAWPRLQRWVEEDRDRSAQLRRLQAWIADHQERGAVLDGPRLAAAQEFAAEHPEDLDAAAQALIRASVDAHGEADRIEAERRASLERSLARARTAALLTGILALLALLLAVASERTHSALQREAQLRLDAPLYRLLERMPADDPRLVLDVLAEIAVSDQPAWLSAADTALGQLPEQRLLSAEPGVLRLAVSSTGALAHLSPDDGLVVLSTNAPKVPQLIGADAVEDMAWDVEGRLLVLQSDGLLLECSPDSEGWLGAPRILRRLELGAPATLIATTEGGRNQVVLHEPEEHRARIVDLEGDADVVVDGGEAPFTTIALIDRGRSLLTASGDPSVAEVGAHELRIWDTRSGELRSTFPLDRSLAIAVASDPTRNALLALTRRGELLSWDRSAPRSEPVRVQTGRGPLVAGAFDPAAERALLSTREGELLIQPRLPGPALRLRGPGGEASTLLAWQGSERALAVDRGGVRSYGAEARAHEPRQMSEAAIRARVYEIASCMPFSQLEALAARHGVGRLTPRNLCAEKRASRVGEVQVGDVLLVLLLPLLFALELALVLVVRRRRREDPGASVEEPSTTSPPASGAQGPPSPIVGLIGTGVVLLLAAGLAFSAINVLEGDAGSSTITLAFVTAWVFATGSRLSPRRIRPGSALGRRLLEVARALMFVVAAVIAIVTLVLYGAPPELKPDRTGASALFTFGLLLATLLITFAVSLRQTSRWLSASPR